MFTDPKFKVLSLPSYVRNNKCWQYFAALAGSLELETELIDQVKGSIDYVFSPHRCHLTQVFQRHFNFTFAVSSFIFMNFINHITTHSHSFTNRRKLPILGTTQAVQSKELRFCNVIYFLTKLGNTVWFPRASFIPLKNAFIAS